MTQLQFAGYLFLMIVMLITVFSWIRSISAAQKGDVAKVRASLKISLVCSPILCLGYAATGYMTRSSLDVLLAMLWAFNFIMARRQLSRLPPNP